MSTSISRKSDALGPIANDQTYPLETFKRLAGLSHWAMRQARRNGLAVRTVGNRRYIRGADWSSYLAKIDDGGSSDGR